MAEKLQQARLSMQDKVMRGLWRLAWLMLFRPSPVLLHGWRRGLLRLFGGKIASDAHVYPSAWIWAPWRLEMGRRSTLGPHVDCYCVARISIGECATVSQYSYLCSASHDYCDPGILRSPEMPLLVARIDVGKHAWVAADVFVGPGVSIGEGAVVLARASVFGDVPSWVVAAGSPATVRKARVLRGGATG